MLSPRGLGGGLEGPMPEARRAGSAARHPSGPCTGWSLGWGSDFRGNWGGERQEQRVAVTPFPHRVSAAAPGSPAGSSSELLNVRVLLTCVCLAGKRGRGVSSLSRSPPGQVVQHL